MENDTSEISGAAESAGPSLDFDALAQRCAEAMVGGAGFEAYDRACAADADRLFGHAGADDAPEERRAALHCMARKLWCAMPDPAARYAPARLPKVERNDACHCGSGLKYKKCCAPVDALLPAIDANLVPFLLEVLPRERWTELPRSAIAVADVVDTAELWIEDERRDDARALLEPWFAADAGYKAKNVELFESLSYLYADADEAAALDTLLARALRVGDASLRGSALRQRARNAAHARDYEAAWAHYRHAEDVDPDALALVDLEVGLLLDEGRLDEAQERARYWLDELDRPDDPGPPEIIDYLNEVLAIETLDDVADAEAEVDADSDLGIESDTAPGSAETPART